ncbi:MAG: biotin attachment protein [Phaeodactylibacter sp.]|nr:biotin attachment protein [Phaeodactylibacter sp.]
MVNGKIFRATVNEKHTFEAINGDLDIIPTSDGHFHIIKDNLSYNAEVISTNYNDKLFELKINGVIYEVKLDDEYDQLVKRLGLSVVTQQVVKDITAPMPGLVLEVSVEAGQEVEEGTPLLILEAMKMENVIKSPGSGIVKNVNVSKGEAVEKSHLLVEME